jgi:hypothetical protein
LPGIAPGSQLHLWLERLEQRRLGHALRHGAGGLRRQAGDDQQYDEPPARAAKREATFHDYGPQSVIGVESCTGREAWLHQAHRASERLALSVPPSGAEE